MKHRTRPSDKFNLTKITLIILVVVIGILAFAMVLNVKNRFEIRSRAQLNPIKIFLAPANGQVPPNQTIQMMIDARDEKIAAVLVEVTFDQTRVQLAGEFGTSDKLRTIIKKSTKDQANSSGRIIIAEGLAAADRGNPPQGTFELARFNFTAINSYVTDNVNVSIDPSAMQVVNFDASEMVVQTENAKIAVNPVTPSNTPYIPPAYVQPTVRPTITPIMVNRGYAVPTTAYNYPIPTGSTAAQSSGFGTHEAKKVEPPVTINIDGDVNGDNCVNMSDLSYCLGAIFSFGTKTCDPNQDGKTNFGDLIYILTKLGNGCVR